LKIWSYIGVAILLLAVFALINSSYYDKILNTLKSNPSPREVIVIVDDDEFILDQLQEMQIDSVQDRFAHHNEADNSQIDIVTRPEPLHKKLSVLEIPQEKPEIRDKKKDRLIVVKNYKSAAVKEYSPVVVKKESPVNEPIDLTGLHITEHYKKVLIKTLTEEGWSERFLNRVSRYMQDPRTRFQPNVLDRNSTHKETSEQYDQHRSKESVDKCMEFWKSHDEEIETAISSYDVPSEIIVAILKVESNFGTHKGRQAVFNVFLSLSIADNPEIMNNVITSESKDAKKQRERLQKRAKWGRSQLHELINLVIDLDNEELLWEVSSWAGAFGLPQFIPTSFRAYARDGNNDGIIELNNFSDASISIANYLKSNGWKASSDNLMKKKVIMRYNNSIHYADCILDLAYSIKWRIEEGN